MACFRAGATRCLGVVLVVTLTAACGTHEADAERSSSPGGTAAATGDAPAEAGCSVTRVMELPAPGSTGASLGYLDPEEAALGHLREMVREVEEDPESLRAVEQGRQLLEEQAEAEGRQQSTVGTADGVTLQAATQYEALGALLNALEQGTVVAQEDEDIVVFRSPQGARWPASVTATHYGPSRWIVDTFAHSLPASECSRIASDSAASRPLDHRLHDHERWLWDARMAF